MELPWNFHDLHNSAQGPPRDLGWHFGHRGRTKSSALPRPPSPRRLKAPKHYAATSATRNHRPRATRTPTSNGAAFGATGATTNCAAEDKTLLSHGSHSELPNFSNIPSFPKVYPVESS